jgi:5-methylcytosine-specific restriction endonuclease McrA
MGKRKAIPAAVKRAVLARSGMICEAEGCENVGREFEHRIPVALDGENTVENIWLSCRSCHRAKTSNEDIPRIAKAKRQARLTGQQARRAAGKTKPIPQPANPWPAKGSRKLQSRGFGS